MSFDFSIRVWALSLLAIVNLGGCAREDSVPPAVDIRVVRLANEGAFKVTWFTSIPARALVFSRDVSLFRAKSWITKDPTMRLQEREGRDILVSTVETQKFEVVIPETGMDIRGDYPMVTAFSDGGMAFYTGHLDATPIHCFQVCTTRDIQDGTKQSPVIRLLLQPAFGEHVTVDSSSSFSAVNVSPPSEGTIAFFGKQTAVKGRGFTALLDPSLPPWVQTEIERFIPQVLDLNARRLGHDPGADPMVLVPYKAKAGRLTLTHAGAVVGNNVLLALYGDTWVRRTDEAREDLLKLVAHEAFHIWNASLFHNVDRPEGRWLHEGGAEAFSYLALADLGIINQRRFTELQTEALNRCLVGLTDASLPGSDGSMSIRNHYECGAIVQTLVSLSLKRRQLDLWRLWAAMLNHAAANKGFYTPEDFMAVLASHGVDETTRSAIVQLTSGEVHGSAVGPGSQLESFFTGAFRDAGGRLAPADQDWPIWYHRLLAEKALAATLDADCSGGGYFIATKSRARLVGSPKCRRLKEDREVTRVDGHDLWSEGVQIYDSVRKTCVSRNTIPLVGDNSVNNLRLPCPSLPRRPAFMQFISSQY